MANFDQLKQSVAALIRTNGAEEITGQIMQDVLLTIINSISGGYMFGGVAQHSGNVGNPDYNVFYLAGSGAYTGYGGAITIEAGCYGVFRYNGVWTQEVVDIGVRLSGSIAPGETRGVTGDVINTALQTLFNNVMDILDTLTFTYNTPSAQQATKAMLDVIVTPTGGASHVLTTLTLASATAAAAGLMSAEDKQKVDRMLTDFRSLSFSDTTAAADQATKIVQTLSATLGEDREALTTFTLLAATASKAGLMSAADKSYLDSLPAVLTGINGAISDNLERVLAMMGYYECSTAAGTAAKEVSASGYSLTSGGCIRIKMTNANTANNVTLNINSTGAKALHYDGAQVSSTNTWEAGEVLEVYYDGTQYQCASGGGGKFATGQKVKEVSITDTIENGSEKLPTSGAVAEALHEFPMVSRTSQDDDFDITDENGNSIVSFGGGHIKTKYFDSALSVAGGFDSSDSDLSINDVHGNVLVDFKNGHIRTRNFDSSALSKSSGLEEIAIGDLIQGAIGEYGVDSTTSSVVSNTIAIPYPSAVLHINVNTKYQVLVKLGHLNGDNGVRFNNTVGTFTNNQTFKLPETTEGNTDSAYSYIRFQIEKIGGGSVSPTDNLDFNVSYKKNYEVIDSNADILDQIQAKASLVNNRNLYSIIVHGSDIHGDFERLKNIYLFAEAIDADAIVLTGDIVAHHYSDNIKSLISLAKNCRVPTCICAGNHEVGFTYSNLHYAIDDIGVYEYVFSELAEEIGYISSGSTISQVSYYFKDIPAKNLRIISMYQYVEGAPDGSLTALRWDLHYNQAEMDWFCATLLSTPENYGILLLMHTPELSQNGGKIQDNDLFFTNYNFGSVRSTVTNGQPILEICDAFISRGTLQKTYTQNGTPSSFTVDVDFSSVPSTIDFIAQVNGHYHRDAIGLVNGATQRQVMLNIACTAGTYSQSHGCDTVRNVKNNTGDSFNVYVINKGASKIDIYKIGTHRTVDDRDRVHMQILYKV